MAIRINKKLTIILVVIAVLIVGGAGGYLLWRINQEDTVAPTDSDAAGCTYTCTKWYSSSSCPLGEGVMLWRQEPLGVGTIYDQLWCCENYTMKCPTSCGNGICETGETATSCAKDCATSCEAFKTQLDCTTEKISLDCAWYANVKECHLRGTLVCGDKICNGTETTATCPGDCPATEEEEEATEEESEIPSWIISKSAVESCIGEGTSTPTSEVKYTITIKNTGEGQGSIDKIIDSLDSKVLSSYIQDDISSDGEFSSGQIVWELTGDAETFISQQQKTYTYTIVIPRSAFGTYNNTVTAYPKDSSDNIEASKTIVIDCDASGDVPQTGIFDSTVSKVVGGLILIIIGFSFTKITDIFNNSINTLGNTVKRVRISIEDSRNERRKSNFEKKVTKKW